MGIGVTPPRYLDPADSQIQQSITPRSTAPPPPTSASNTSRSNSLSRPTKTPPQPPPKEKKPKYAAINEPPASPISPTTVRRNSSELFKDLKSRFEQPGSPPTFRLTNSAHNTPKNTRRTSKKFVTSSVTTKPLPQKEAKPINPPASSRLSNKAKKGS